MCIRDSPSLRLSTIDEGSSPSNSPPEEYGAIGAVSPLGTLLFRARAEHGRIRKRFFRESGAVAHRLAAYAIFLRVIEALARENTFERTSAPRMVVTISGPM